MKNKNSKLGICLSLAMLAGMIWWYFNERSKKARFREEVEGL